jgi:hypothetical protein
MGLWVTKFNLRPGETVLWEALANHVRHGIAVGGKLAASAEGSGNASRFRLTTAPRSSSSTTWIDRCPNFASSWQWRDARNAAE